MKFTVTLSLLFAAPSLIDAFIQNSPMKTSMGAFSTMPGGPEYSDSASASMEPRLATQAPLPPT
eukprot:CAMPEP_0194129194 /NCGR_PEP_ID=MMETSP0152-20130528/439_1 /TAXON_ID=1049557 /ORGANISM="Thalassiothrix antarctica, Strain L6-D1" /LENGTH=63 /DNA_ID=CAMNT_0038823313 /DNA_START=33 /DNA_END=220 /DNA_ORIENTATION=+